MNNTITKELRKSELNATSEFDFHQIKEKHPLLLDYEFTRKEDELYFEFHLQDDKSFIDITKEDLSTRFQVLMNVSSLKSIAQYLSFALTSENIYYGLNNNPKVMLRDVYKENAFKEENFVHAYKSLIGYALNPKYTFEDYAQGGEKLLAKAALTQPYLEAESIEDVIHTLKEQFKAFDSSNKQNKLRVEKSKFNYLVWFRRVASLIIVLLVVISGYFVLVENPQNKAIMSANESYIKQDYVATIASFRSVPISKLSLTNKYIFAVSYIKSDSLSDVQKNNILASVVPASNEKIFDYWMHLSNKDYESATDVAKQLGNKEYLLYSYMKEKAYIESDESLSGNDRATKIKDLEAKINELTKESTTNATQSEGK